MNKEKIFIISLIFLFFIALSSVSAIENEDTMNNKVVANEDENIHSSAQYTVTKNKQTNIKKEDSYNKNTADTNNNQVNVKNGGSIQSAIDNATPGSTILVEEGTYSEDIIIPKGLSIKGQNAVLYSDKTAFAILPTANYTSIAGFNIFVSDANGTGIFINASNCNISDNIISGGNRGILADMVIFNDSGELGIDMVGNISVVRNTVYNVGEAGILIKAFNPTVCLNNVTNITNSKENGTAYGIQVGGMGVISDDLNVIVTNNNVLNVKSLKDSAYGLDVAGNSVFDSLIDFQVFGNNVGNVVASVESVGTNVGIFSLNTTLPTINVSDIKITNISSNDCENASITGLSVSVTTIGQNDTSDAIVHNITINNLNATGNNSAATGIDATGVGCVDIYISNNTINNINATKTVTGIAATGIEYINFDAFVDVSNNNITNIKSPKIKGINVLSLGNATINKNILSSISGNNSTFITGVTLSISMDNFNASIPANATIEEIKEILNNISSKLEDINLSINGDLTVIGNNLESTGIGTGFMVVRPSTINYNRAVNMEYNVIKDSTRTFILESYDYDPNMSNEELAYILIKSQQQFENCTEEELRNMSVSMGAFLDKLFDNLNNLTAGDVDARYNWWGNNSKPLDSKFINNHGTVMYEPWLTLRISANPETINIGDYSKITADVYMDSSGLNHKSNATSFFSGPKLTFSTDKGKFNGKKSLTLNWTNGKSISYLKGMEFGLATIKASDYDTAFAHVLIIRKKHYNKDKTDNYEIITINDGVKTVQPAENEDQYDMYIKVEITTKKDEVKEEENYITYFVIGGIVLLGSIGVYIIR